MTRRQDQGGTATWTTEVLVIGGGFAGLEVGRALGRAGIPTMIVDRRNHHLFQPLLYQVATAALSAADVAEPVRKILRRYRSVQVILGEVEQIDATLCRARLGGGEVISYRHLVLAPGSGHSYFGHDDWAAHAPGLKTIEDARSIRSRLLVAFERAERCTDPEEKRRLLTFAIIGAGPTGVELAGSISELGRLTLAREFRTIDPASIRIMLIEAGPRILSGFPEEMADYARDRLARRGIEIRTKTPVEHIGPEQIRMAGQSIDVGLIIWAAGVRPSPLAAQVAETDRGGRAVVDARLLVPGFSNVFVLGDAAACPDAEGNPLPGLAQVAQQQGRHLGRALVAHIRDNRPLPEFRYRSRGNTAIIGRHAAVFDHHRFKLRGWIAWLAWALIHVYLLVGFQNRVLVSTQWLWRYLTEDRGARVIDGEVAEKAALQKGPSSDA
ncbi:NAD(P)/FAD-dependent oxidoreductase [Paracoccus beibuensis]|uniref:NAD(P)/FAD-dependent oxidoreductase n=1 Tax=Paracoccus beibuensis TaxID=547602 RepID=UPI0022402A7A|nr:NAD(P)/FAD-dependent oxidoreductase [Paracoccus beibuensis]